MVLPFCLFRIVSRVPESFLPCSEPGQRPLRTSKFSSAHLCSASGKSLPQISGELTRQEDVKSEFLKCVKRIEKLKKQHLLDLVCLQVRPKLAASMRESDQVSTTRVNVFKMQTWKNLNQDAGWLRMHLMNPHDTMLVADVWTKCHLSHRWMKKQIENEKHIEIKKTHFTLYVEWIGNPERMYLGFPCHRWFRSCTPGASRWSWAIQMWTTKVREAHIILKRRQEYSDCDVFQIPMLTWHQECYHATCVQR